MWTADATDGVRSRRPRRARLKARGSDRFDDADDAAADDDDDARAWLNEESIGEAGSVLLLVLMSILYGSAVPVFYDPTAAAAWRLTPGLHTFTRSFIAAALLAPAFVFLPPAPASARRGGAIDPGRVARFGVEFGVVVFLATFAQWKHADNVAPESFFLALALAPVLAVVSRRGVPGAEVPSDVPTSKFEKGAATQVRRRRVGRIAQIHQTAVPALSADRAPPKMPAGASTEPEPEPNRTDRTEPPSLTTRALPHPTLPRPLSGGRRHPRDARPRQRPGHGRPVRTVGRRRRGAGHVSHRSIGGAFSSHWSPYDRVGVVNADP
jgi:hypothetical protein